MTEEELSVKACELLQQKPLGYFSKNDADIYTDGFTEGYKECEKKLDDAKSIIESLLKNRPDTYSGTNIELQQKKMFAFQNAVEQAYALLRE